MILLLILARLLCLLDQIAHKTMFIIIVVDQQVGNVVLMEQIVFRQMGQIYILAKHGSVLGMQILSIILPLLLTMIMLFLRQSLVILMV